MKYSMLEKYFKFGEELHDKMAKEMRQEMLSYNTN
jgi:hypothetical protein